MTRQAKAMNAKQARGLCRACPAPAYPGRTLCKPHLFYHARKNRAYRARVAPPAAKGARA